MKNIILMFWARFFNGLHFFSSVILLYFTDVVGLSVSDYFFLQAMFSFFVFFLEIPTGLVADRFSRRFSLILGGVFAVLGCLTFFYARSFNLILLAQFLIALGFALTSGAFESLFYDLHTDDYNLFEKYNRNLAFLNNLNLIAIFISTLIGSLIAKFFGLVNIYLITSFGFLLGTICFLFLSDSKNTSQGEVKRNKSILNSVFSVLRSNVKLRVLALDLAFVPAVCFMSIWLYQPFLKSFSASIIFYGVLHASMVFMQVAINFILPYFKHSIDYYIKYSQVFLATMFFVLGIANNIWIGSICLVFIVGVGLTRNTFLNKEINSHIKSSFRSTFFSGVSMLNQLIRMILTFLLGYLINISFSFVAYLLCLVLLISFFYTRKFEASII